MIIRRCLEARTRHQQSLRLGSAVTEVILNEVTSYSKQLGRFEYA